MSTGLLILAVVAGGTIGQACVVAIITGLHWQSWSKGFAMGTVIGSAGYLICMAGNSLVDNIDSETFLVVSVIPGILLSLVLPLIALRLLFGWRLVRCGETAPRKELFRIEDMLCLTAIAAASLALMSIVPRFADMHPGDDFFVGMIFICALAFGIGLLALPVFVRLALGTKSCLMTLLFLSIIACINCIAALAIIQALGGLSASKWRTISTSMLAISGGAISTTHASLLFLAWSGMSWTRAKRSTASAVSSLEVNRDSPARPDRSSRWVTAIFVSMAIGSSLALTPLERSRERTNKEATRLESLAKLLEGEIDYWNYQISSITLGAPATDDDLEHFRDCRDVNIIDLSDSQVTDLGLMKLRYFPKTTSLTLNNTRITNDGLVVLNDLHDLTELNLDDTNIDGRGIAHIHMIAALDSLSLDNTPFGDLGCKKVVRFPKLETLSLVGTRVTDQGLRQMTTAVISLALGHTAVNGEGLSHLSSPRDYCLRPLVQSNRLVVGEGDRNRRGVGSRRRRQECAKPNRNRIRPNASRNRPTAPTWCFDHRSGEW